VLANYVHEFCVCVTVLCFRHVIICNIYIFVFRSLVDDVILH